MIDDQQQQKTQEMLRLQRTKIMGILNVTPDSFAGDGVMKNQEDYVQVALPRIHKFAASQVEIIDVGGESTRPGSAEVPLEEEVMRVVPVIRAIRQFYDIPISIDTTKARVAQEALAAGANIINDVSGLLFDSEMVHVVREHKVPVVIMHSQQPHFSHLDNPFDRVANHNQTIVDEVMESLEQLTRQAMNQGVLRQQIIVDPGIGFGKTVQENLSLIRNIDRIKSLGYPVLLGVSRKSFIGHTTKSPIHQRMPESIAAMTIGIMKGADIMRVHDVEESVQAARIIDAIRLAR